MGISKRAMSNAVTPLDPRAERILERLNDVYLVEDGPIEDTFAYGGSEAVKALKGPELRPILESVLRRIQHEHPKGLEFSFIYGHTRWRCRRVIGGPYVRIAMRQVAPEVPFLDTLHMPQPWRHLLIDENLNGGGLIVLTGVMGSGKSTTLASVIKSRLDKYAGFCLTVEDPIELELDGYHGQGRCVQTDLSAFKKAYSTIEEQGIPSDSEAYCLATKGALRSFPAGTKGASLLLLGEIRDGATAAEVLRQANNGSLILTTLHADDPQTAMSRLAAMGQVELGPTVARDLLASAMRVVIHQRLIDNPDGTGWDRKHIDGEILVSNGRTSPAVNAIRMGDFKSLKQVMRGQHLLLRNAQIPWKKKYEQLFGS